MAGGVDSLNVAAAAAVALWAVRPRTRLTPVVAGSSYSNSSASGRRGVTGASTSARPTRSSTCGWPQIPSTSATSGRTDGSCRAWSANVATRPLAVAVSSSRSRASPATTQSCRVSSRVETTRTVLRASSASTSLGLGSPAVTAVDEGVDREGRGAQGASWGCRRRSPVPAAADPALDLVAQFGVGRLGPDGAPQQVRQPTAGRGVGDAEPGTLGGDGLAQVEQVLLGDDVGAVDPAVGVPQRDHPVQQDVVVAGRAAGRRRARCRSAPGSAGSGSSATSGA